MKSKLRKINALFVDCVVLIGWLVAVMAPVHGATSSPSISSTVIPSGTFEPWNIIIGGSAIDVATVSGGSNPTGTVAYTAYSDIACTVTAFADTEPLGTPSKPFTPSAAGSYHFIASYSGDANNNPVSTTCGSQGETLTVGKATRAVATTVVDASNKAPWSGSEATGASAYDNAILTRGNFIVLDSTACGTVGGAWNSTTSTCTDSASFSINILIPSGTTLYINGTGSYVFSHGNIDNHGLIYATGPARNGGFVSLGILNNDGNMTTYWFQNGACCGIAPATLNNYGLWNSFGVVYNIGATINNYGTWTGSFFTNEEAIGGYHGIVFNCGSFNGGSIGVIAPCPSPVDIIPSGTLQYDFWTNGFCDGTSTTQTVTLESSGNVPNSSSTAPLAAGSYSFTAAYSGDNNYFGSNSSCEPFTVLQGPTMKVRVSKFFTDPSLNPLPLDSKGNPKVDVVIAGGVVRSTNPGEIMAWVNVTNTDGSLQSLKLNETLPMDWVIAPPWMPALGAIHVFYANTTSLATNPEITQPSTITVSGPSPPQTVHVAIPSFNATAIGHPLLKNQSILLEVKLDYALDGTTQSASTYPRNYTDTASATAWSGVNFTGSSTSGNATGLFVAYAKVVGDVDSDGSVDITDLVLEWQHQFSNNPQYDVDGDGAVDINDLVLTWQFQFT